MSEEKLKAIAENAKWGFNVKLPENVMIRPLYNGARIYSIDKEYPMRGIDTKTVITEKNINSYIMKYAENKKFRERITEAASGFREDDIQAAFYRGMIDNDPEYDGIKPVTAEFLLAEANKRIDVLGIKDNVLYIFELKKGRENQAFDQVKRYRKEILDISFYLEMLKHYPNINEIKDIKCVCVMEYVEKTKLNKPNDIDLWLYETAMQDKHVDKLKFHKS